VAGDVERCCAERAAGGTRWVDGRGEGGRERILSSSRSATGWRVVPGSAPPLRLVTDPQWLCSRVELASKTRREAAERSVPDLVFELASSGGQVGQRGTFQAGSGFHEGLEVPGEFTGLLRAEDLLQDFLEGRH
jgi:hypothetical protein